MPKLLLSSRLTDGDKQDLLPLTSRVPNWAQCVLAATNLFRTPRNADLAAGVSGSALYLLKCRTHSDSPESIGDDMKLVPGAVAVLLVAGDGGRHGVVLP